MVQTTSIKQPISAFIITKNEEDRIARAVNSVINWVDEVIVVDSGSTDNTISIAKSCGAIVIEKDWPGYGPQKRFAEEQCKNRWVLNIDADEEITTNLAKEIQGLFTPRPPAGSAYILKIRDVYPHQQKPSRFAYTYRVVRLYNLDDGRYSNSPIHDRVEFDTNTRIYTLKNDIHQRSIRSLSHLNAKNNTYTDLQAEIFYQKGRQISAWRLIVEFPISFLNAYIRRGHFLRGSYGFILSMQYAYTRFMRVAKIIEKKNLP
ncbi:MAG: glycosyltransferase family 2 protein [Alphaproteobacteria bacterium]|nr:glycosyltransferase family 2 protein [Alphaproteobacteria bacterium]